MRAFVLVDLGFGDAGKGLLTDYLVRSTGATVVVRYNGGAQAGHNVVSPEGRHHTFAQLGAGSFVAGVRTFLSRHVVVHPTALLVEAEELRAKGAGDVLSRLCISEDALLITPYHQAAGRLRELARGAARHGSCGTGVGEAVGDALRLPHEAIMAGDLRDPARLRPRLERVRERKLSEIEQLGAAGEPHGAPDGDARELQALRDPGLLERWLAAAAHLARRGLVTADSILTAWLAGAGAAVFEGAQGVLLDEWSGFHPYTTWSACTTVNAMEILAAAAPGAEVERIGVMRTHAVRHGPGPLPTETAELRAAVREHNRHGRWQGPVRYGWFDAVLARYALEVAAPIDTLALTHLDVPARLGRWRVCGGYRLAAAAPGDGLAGGLRAGAAEALMSGAGVADGAGTATRIAVSAERDLARQARLTKLLFRAEPRLEDCEPTPAAVVRRTEQLLARRVDWVASGPRAGDVAATGATTARGDQYSDR